MEYIEVEGVPWLWSGGHSLYIGIWLMFVSQRQIVNANERIEPSGFGLLSG